MSRDAVKSLARLVPTTSARAFMRLRRRNLPIRVASVCDPRVESKEVKGVH